MTKSLPVYDLDPDTPLATDVAIGREGRFRRRRNSFATDASISFKLWRTRLSKLGMAGASRFLLVLDPSDLANDHGGKRV